MPMSSSHRALVILALALLVPLAIRSNYTMQVVNLALINVIVVLGLNFVTGFTGQVNFGQAAFYGIGAYSTALLTKAGCPFLLALPVSGASAGLFALLLGIPTLRLSSFYLAMATIGFGEIVRLVLLHWEEVTGGSSGLRDIPGIALGPLRIATPSARNAAIIASVSSLASTRVTSVSPAASALNSRMRLDRLFEPGRRTVPSNRAIGSSVRRSGSMRIPGGHGLRECVPQYRSAAGAVGKVRNRTRGFRRSSACANGRPHASILAPRAPSPGMAQGPRGALHR